VENGPLCATQFHPEKSGDAGARLLRNWVESLPGRSGKPAATAPEASTPEAASAEAPAAEASTPEAGTA
jgi:glutamine amidotransferase